MVSLRFSLPLSICQIQRLSINPRFSGNRNSRQSRAASSSNKVSKSCLCVHSLQTLDVIPLAHLKLSDAVETHLKSTDHQNMVQSQISTLLCSAIFNGYLPSFIMFRVFRLVIAMATFHVVFAQICCCWYTILYPGSTAAGIPRVITTSVSVYTKRLLIPISFCASLCILMIQYNPNIFLWDEIQYQQQRWTDGSWT